MKDWKAAVRSWYVKNKDTAPKKDSYGGFVIAPAEDPFEVAVREGKYKW